jgi:acetyltransferase-like isoleucine patch superfamily enzyme
MIRNLKVEIHGDDNLVVIGDRSWLRSVRITIRGSSNRIVLGENVQIGGPGHLWVEDNQGELSIGSDCTLETGVTLAVLEGCALTLGQDCMIAGDVEIRTGDSHGIFDRCDSGARLNQPQPVTLGDHVWVGKRSVLLKGVELAAGVIIGAGSVVTKSVDETGAVVAGNPARVVRRDVQWQR